MNKELLLAVILCEKRELRFFPQGRSLVVKAFKDSFHQGLAKKFGPVPYPEPVAINAEGPELPVVEHHRKPVGPL